MTNLDHSSGDCVELFHVQAKGGKARVVYKHVIVEKSRFFRYKAADEVSLSLAQMTEANFRAATISRLCIDITNRWSNVESSVPVQGRVSK